VFELRPGPAPSPEGELLRRERLVFVKRAFRVLSPRLLSIARLRYFEEKSCKDIAREVGIEQPSVSPYLAVVRDRLRTALRSVYRLPDKAKGRSPGGFVRFINAPRLTWSRRQNDNAAIAARTLISAGSQPFWIVRSGCKKTRSL
jgi:hypothetical protein